MKLQPEKDQFLALIEDHKKIIFKVCNAYCKDSEDRKDLVQEVIIQLWQSFGRYNDQYKLSTWIYRIALNVAISFYRTERTRKNRTQSIHDAIIEIGDETQDTESNSGLLHRFINQLDELNRALMILYLDEKSYREISEILGISETNVATKINRIKQKLKLQFSKF
ncbi:RNA polymerase sigma factor [Larkinella terrae]|uniref:Sigma-70 family RNA polymerase sigma factor n=1 Tax=Larkinella terrae TaxID=2025311 RepID=A0A7K0ETA6_9BACT|nr:sigma-70 family RNA polymerase sigma factor [Larkinella terrae]MRS65047.1 sigma-70 family RNA polymerase sigma factor [Larkinella terrae]